MTPDRRFVWGSFWEWAALGIALPIAMIVVGWILAVVLAVPHPFLHVFGTAELLVVSVLFVIPVMLEIGRTAETADLSVLHRPMMVIAIVLLVALYSALRVYAQKLSARVDLPEEAIWVMSGVAGISIALTFASVVYATFIRYKIMEAQIATLGTAD